MEKITNRKYAVPFVLVTSLFFLWGFARSILDVLNKHFQETLHLSITQSTWIQVTTYLAYFLMAIPAGMVINRFGYRRGVVIGLLLFALGAFAFVPASMIGKFGLFLTALFVIGCGLAFLETSANPYSTELGPKKTATSRLNLSQSFNGLGSSLAPSLVGGFLFAGGGVEVPYMAMGGVVVVAAIIFSFVSLPEITSEETTQSATQQSGWQNIKVLFRNGGFMLGLSALFAYEVAEISINSYFIQFTTGMKWLDAASASHTLTGALMCFMVGRFVCSFLMKFIKAKRILLVCAIGSVICISIVLCCHTKVGMYALIANYVFESIMFPTIFAQSLHKLGHLTKNASSLLMMTPVGGCAFMLVGVVADSIGFVAPFFITLAAFCLVLLYSITINCRK